MSGFVDEAQIHVKGGDGGAGSVSFRREAHVAMGGPDGGDGGRGGDVWLVASNNVASLLRFRDHPHCRAGDGKHGTGKRCHGSRGPDLEVLVPVGTSIRALDGSSLVELLAPGERWLAGHGGRGGHGNARFLSNQRRAPSFAEQGEVGEERWMNVELKLMADVALVGFPNAGKSTLISRISAAKPKIADYPFTTLEPHLGVVRTGGRLGDETEFVVADIPGLVEGAAEGKGLGHKFLRHVERSRALVILLDAVADDLRSPEQQLDVLLDELRRYRPELLHRPRLVVISKIDAIGGEAITMDADCAISSATGDGIEKLLGLLAPMVVQERARSEEGSTRIVVHRPVSEQTEVSRADDGSWVVDGKAALRAVALSDLTGDEAMDYVQGRLRKLGVERALVRAGVREGDLVHIGQLSFTYHRDQELLQGGSGR